MSNVRLKQNVFERFVAMKTHLVHVKDCFQSLGYFHVDSGVVNEDPGIDEVGLAFDLAAAKRRQNAVRLNQASPGLGQPDSISIPKRELAANKIRIIEDRVKARRLCVRRILVALRPEKRSTKA